MRQLLLAAAVCALVSLLGCAAPVERQTVHRFVRKCSMPIATIEMDYLLYLPPGYELAADSERQWPLMLFLHGIGEVGSNPHKVARIGPPKRIERGYDFPMIVVSPQNDGRFDYAWWNDLLIALLDDLQTRYRIDPDRVFVSGASLGGFGAWNLACAHPERFAAAVPVAGFGYPSEVSRMRDVPVWAFHGRRDRVVPIARGRVMVDALRAAGGTARWTVYEDVEHSAWHRAFRDPELLAWLLERRRGSTSLDP